jgi:hypothetical protein
VRSGERAACGEGAGEENHGGHGVTRGAGYKSSLLWVTPRTPWLIIIFVTTHIIMFGHVASRAAWGGGAGRWADPPAVVSGRTCRGLL